MPVKTLRAPFQGNAIVVIETTLKIYPEYNAYLGIAVLECLEA